MQLILYSVCSLRNAIFWKRIEHQVLWLSYLFNIFHSFRSHVRHIFPYNDKNTCINNHTSFAVIWYTVYFWGRFFTDLCILLFNKFCSVQIYVSGPHFLIWYNLILAWDFVYMLTGIFLWHWYKIFQIFSQLYTRLGSALGNIILQSLPELLFGNPSTWIFVNFLLPVRNGIYTLILHYKKTSTEI